MSKPTEKQIKRLIDASQNLAACLARDACRVIVEGPDDMDLLPYLESLPVKTVREFDEALLAITEPEYSDEEADVRRKYEQTMREMREGRS